MTVEIGQYWRRPNGVIVEVIDERVAITRDVQLRPVVVPLGLAGRTTWKFDRAVEQEFEQVYPEWGQQ